MKRLIFLISLCLLSQNQTINMADAVTDTVPVPPVPISAEEQAMLQKTLQPISQKLNEHNKEEIKTQIPPTPYQNQQSIAQQPNY